MQEWAAKGFQTQAQAVIANLLAAGAATVDGFRELQFQSCVGRKQLWGKVVY